jgi:glycosyltransferase involved in cell wall biosynthesis
MGHKKIISIVLPIFNEEANISYIYQELVTTLSAVQERYSYEIIMVDDGSSDKSWSTIRQISEVDKNVVGVHFSRNFGKEIALSAGIDACVGDCVITMDSD